MDRNRSLFRQEYTNFLGTGAEMELFVVNRNGGIQPVRTGSMESSEGILSEQRTG